MALSSILLRVDLAGGVAGFPTQRWYTTKDPRGKKLQTIHGAMGYAAPHSKQCVAGNGPYDTGSWPGSQRCRTSSGTARTSGSSRRAMRPCISAANPLAARQASALPNSCRKQRSAVVRTFELRSGNEYRPDRRPPVRPTPTPASSTGFLERLLSRQGLSQI